MKNCINKSPSLKCDVSFYRKEKILLDGQFNLGLYNCQPYSKIQ